MSDDPIVQAFPAPAPEGLTDDGIAALYSAEVGALPWVRVNFVSSVDGAATHDGLSGGLGTPADHRVFDLLRRLCDVVLVGAGTARAERYGPIVLDETAAAWRADHGLRAQPVFAIVSAALELDAASRIFTEAPVRPIVVTVGSSPVDRRAALAEVAEVIVAGDDALDSPALVAELVARGLSRIHCEGGPTLFGTLLAAGVVDELCLTVSPMLEGGDSRRVVAGALAQPTSLTLAGVLSSESTLLLRYLTRPPVE